MNGVSLSRSGWKDSVDLLGFISLSLSLYSPFSLGSYCREQPYNRDKKLCLQPTTSQSWDHVNESTAVWVNLEVGLSPGEPWDDRSPGEHLHFSPVRDPEHPANYDPIPDPWKMLWENAHCLKLLSLRLVCYAAIDT